MLKLQLHLLLVLLVTINEMHKTIALQRSLLLARGGGGISNTETFQPHSNFRQAAKGWAR